LKEGDTYYLWLNSYKTSLPRNGIEQRLESQDGLVWRNRTDTDLVLADDGSGYYNYKHLCGIRDVINDGITYEAWEIYYFESSRGWATAVRYITSTNGINWRVVNPPSLIGTSYPSVLKNAGFYQMWANVDVDGRLYPSISEHIRYRTSNEGASGWGHWQTGGDLVMIDGAESESISRVRRSRDDVSFELFYVRGNQIHLATSITGLTFTTQITNVLDLAIVLPDLQSLRDFAVVDADGDDWFYFVYGGQDGQDHIAVSRPLVKLEISKEGPDVAAAGDPITYTLTISNVGTNPATDVVVTDTMPTGASYIDGSGGTQTGNVVTWNIPLLPTNTVTQVHFAVTATETITNQAYEVKGRGDYRAVGEEAVVTVVFGQAAPQSMVYLPVILREYVPPQSFPVHIGDRIGARNVAYQGELFYIRSLRIPADLPTGGHFYFSSQQDAMAPVLIDDELAVLLNGSEVFSHDFSAGGGPPQPAIVEVPRPTMEQLAGQTVRVEYRDVYGYVVEASPVWLIWMP
jgi:uncharacterized repeat protein (TIGR01451 family)